MEESENKEKTDDDIITDWNNAVTEHNLLTKSIEENEDKKHLNVILDMDELSRITDMELLDNLMDHTQISLDHLSRIVHDDKGFEDCYFTITRFHDLVEKTKVRQIRAEKLNKLVCFDGLVRICSTVEPRLRSVRYLCMDCNNEFEYTCDGDEELPLTEIDCPTCHQIPEDGVTRIRDSEKFTNYMECEMEEEPEASGGKQPERVKCEIIGPLTNEGRRIILGDRISLIGIPKARRKDKKTLNYTKYIQVMGIFNRGKNYDDLKASEADEKRYIAMSKDPDLIKNMAAAIAPHIYGWEIEKEGLVVQAFGGNLFSKERRGVIHILIVGDPGTAKSKLVRHLALVHPRSVHVSGAPTTAVGITACMVQDPQKGGFTVEAGAAVQADGAIMILDELDKMDKQVMGAMHEIMEDGTCTITKGNVNMQFQARCAVLAIMNPKYNRFVPTEQIKITDQIELLPSFLSRFDLIFALRDVPNVEKDGKVVSTIFDARDGVQTNSKYNTEDLTKYIIYARSRIKEMTTSQEARDIISKYFLNIRTATKDIVNVAITFRQVEGMARLAEGHAKMRLSSVVEKQDAEFSIKMMDYFLKTMAMDNETGQFSTDILIGAPTNGDRKRDMTLKSAIMKAYIEMDKSSPSVNGYKIPLFDIKENFLKNSDLEHLSDEKKEKKWDEAYDKLEEDRELKAKLFIKKSPYRDYVIFTPRSVAVDKEQ